jgi:hypothetical protein
MPHPEGWYGSFKWMTSPKWCGSANIRDRYQGRFRDALNEYFPQLDEFQRSARTSTSAIGGRKPVGPDLWFPLRRGHRFVEVKLPGDHVGRHQPVGLALIATMLPSDRPFSVEVVHLHNGPRPSRDSGLVREFESLCRKLRKAKNRQTLETTNDVRWRRLPSRV